MSFDDFDAFDAAFAEALQGGEQPSDGFTERVMARVSRTPQKKRLPKRRLAALAACCAAVLLAMPFLTLRRGNATKGFNAAPAEMPAAAPAEAGSMLTADRAEPETFAAPSAPAAPPADREPAAPADRKTANEAYHADETGDLTAENGAQLPVVRIDDAQKRAAVTALLDERSCRREGGYVLTAEDVAAVCAAVEGLDLPAEGCLLAA